MHQPKDHPEHIPEGRWTYTLHFGRKVKVVERQDIVLYRHGKREENKECFRKLLEVIWRESDPHPTLSAFPSKDFCCAINLGDINSLSEDDSNTILRSTTIIIEEVLKIKCGEVVLAKCGCIIVSGESRDEP
ncbi:hypothetical protein EON76_04645 [bacterium]|nr:MAG: hypothetical protein EON76_04645 [bacterium]